MHSKETERLRMLQADVDLRVRRTLAAHPRWPCRKGCDLCCRHLADVPRLTFAEWSEVHSAFAILPAAVQDNIRAAVSGLSGATRPITCPFLDTEDGSCRIYEHRPVACRTYGFYVERDAGMFCETIERSAPADVVWGNQAAVQARLQALGPERDLPAWFEELSKA